MTDEAIVARFRETGDARWFEMLVVRHRERIYQAVRRFVFHPEDGADLTQEVFVKAYFALPKFRAEASFGTWLYRIAVNHCLNHLSRRSEPDASALPLSPEAPGPPDDAELRLHVRSCLDRLGRDDRAALVLKYVEDLDHSDIARLLGISVSASKMRVRRAKERFLRLYHGDE